MPSLVSFLKWPFILITVLLIVTNCLTVATLGADAPMDLATLLRKMELNWQQPLPMGFSQEVETKGWLGKWHFTGSVIRDEQGTHVTVSGAPPFVSPDLLADLADFKKAMAGFDLKYSGKVNLDKTECYLLSGVRRKGFYSGALEGSIWVDANTFLIRRLKARYSWGSVDVEQTYTQKDGFTVLIRQEASISPYGMHMTVVYSDYWFKKR